MPETHDDEEAEDKRDPEEIRRDMDVTREMLADDIADLQEVVRRKLDVKAKLRELVERVTRAVEARPVVYLAAGAAALALGVALFSRRRRLPA